MSTSASRTLCTSRRRPPPAPRGLPEDLHHQRGLVVEDRLDAGEVEPLVEQLRGQLHAGQARRRQDRAADLHRPLHGGALEEPEAGVGRPGEVVLGEAAGRQQVHVVRRAPVDELEHLLARGPGQVGPHHVELGQQGLEGRVPDEDVEGQPVADLAQQRAPLHGLGPGAVVGRDHQHGRPPGGGTSPVPVSSSAAGR
jgi:hypothetical protein